MSGQHCPGCGTAFLPDFRPACDCALRAREAAAARQEPQPQPEAPSAEVPLTEVPLAEVPLTEVPLAEGVAGSPAPAGPDPVFGHIASPDAVDSTLTQEVLQLFDEAPDASRGAEGIPEFSRSETPGAAGRGWRYGLIAGAAAVVAVTVGVAGGFFSGGEPDTQAGASGAADTVTVSDSPTPSASPTERQRERADRSSQRPSSTPTRAVTAAEDPTNSAPATPTASPSTSSQPSEPTPTSAPSTQEEGPRTLRRGDHGEQVVELQQRLQQLQLYVGPVNGNYSADVEDAVARFQSARQIPEQAGVYGPQTREAVESETTEP